MIKSPDIPRARIISQTAEHALRALLYLAQQDDAVAATEIARATGAPANYLSKTLQVLARHGYVVGMRGPSGGFRLVRDPSQITIGEVSALFADVSHSRMCLLGGTMCSHDHPCVAHAKWNAMQADVARVLSSISLTGLLNQNAENLELTIQSGGWS